VKLWRIQEDGLYGFVDSIGNVVIEPQYKYIGNFHSGYACVITDAIVEIKDVGYKEDTLLRVKYGYINADNQVVIDTTNIAFFSMDPSVSTFSERFLNGHLGFTEIVLNKLDLVNDRFLFQDEKTMKFGYKDSEGKIVIAPKFKSANSFSNGRAVVQGSIANDRSLLSEFNHFGAIDVNGNIAVNYEYAFIPQFGKNKETWAASISMDEESNSINIQWTLIDENGKILVPPSQLWDYVYNSDEGIYVGKVNFMGVITGYTFIDKSGNMLTDYNHDGFLNLSSDEETRTEILSDVTAFSEGFAGVKGMYGDDYAWFFVNEQIKSDFVPYDSLLYYSGGLAAVKEYIEDSPLGIHSGDWGFIDKEANVVIPYQYKECGSFRGALAYFKKRGSTYDVEGYINKKGDIVWQTKCRK
jgi:hypothetical protein